MCQQVVIMQLFIFQYIPLHCSGENHVATTQVSSSPPETPGEWDMHACNVVCVTVLYIMLNQDILFPTVYTCVNTYQQSQSLNQPFQYRQVQLTYTHTHVEVSLNVRVPVHFFPYILADKHDCTVNSRYSGPLNCGHPSIAATGSGTDWIAYTLFAAICLPWNAATSLIQPLSPVPWVTGIARVHCSIPYVVHDYYQLAIKFG